MRITAKDFAIKNNVPLATVKRYCKQGLFRYHKIGVKYSIDEAYALKVLSDLDQQQQTLDKPIKKMEINTIHRRDSKLSYLDKLKEMRRNIA